MEEKKDTLMGLDAPTTPNAGVVFIISTPIMTCHFFPSSSQVFDHSVIVLLVYFSETGIYCFFFLGD